MKRIYFHIIWKTRTKLGLGIIKNIATIHIFIRWGCYICTHLCSCKYAKHLLIRLKLKLFHKYLLQDSLSICIKEEALVTVRDRMMFGTCVCFMILCITFICNNLCLSVQTHNTFQYLGKFSQTQGVLTRREAIHQLYQKINIIRLRDLRNLSLSMLKSVQDICAALSLPAPNFQHNPLCKQLATYFAKLKQRKMDIYEQPFTIFIG